MGHQNARDEGKCEQCYIHFMIFTIQGNMFVFAYILYTSVPRTQSEAFQFGASYNYKTKQNKTNYLPS
jgi:hypothetical protein